MINKPTKRKNDIGASLPEFALGFPVIMLLIVFLIDAGLYLYQNALLIDGTASVNRQIVTALGQSEAVVSQSCGVLVSNEGSIAKQVRQQVTTSLPLLFRDMTFYISISTTLPVPYRLVSLDGQFPFRCLTCKFFNLAGVPLILHSTSVQVIERPTLASSCLAVGPVEI